MLGLALPLPPAAQLQRHGFAPKAAVVRPGARPRRPAHLKPAPRRGAPPAAILSTGSPTSSRETEGVTLPLNYAELMGLQDVQLPLQPAVEKAYEELMNMPLEDGYSELARLGKEKILFAARERLLGVRGRTALLSPTVQVEPLLLPGAMALLHQLRRYDLVIQLSEEGAALGARGMRASSRDTLRDLECDMALATALAQCGLADRALRESKPALACARLQEALKLLTDAPAVTSRQLAPRLQQDICKALADYHPDAVADYLQIPLDQAEYELRAREVAALRQWVAAPAAALRRDQSPILTPEYMARIVPKLTSVELVGIYDWQALAAGGNSARCPWYYQGLLKRAALGHLIAGFVERRPLLVQIARRLFATIQRNGDDPDTALSLAMCNLLLGDTDSALRLLEEDERAQQQQQQQQGAAAAKRGKGRGAAAAAAVAAAEVAAAAADASSGPFDAAQSSGSSGSSGSSKRSAAAGPEGRHAVMQYIRAHSPEGGLDLRPGLVQFGAWWLERVAYPEFQDTALGAAPRPAVAAYFEDPRVQAFLAAEDGKPTGGLRGMLSNARSSLLARFAPPLEPPLPSSSRNGAAPPLPRVSLRGALPWLAGATAVASLALYAASVARSMGWQPWQQQVEPLPPAMAEAAAAIGLPEYAVRPHYSAELDSQLSQRRPRQAAAAAAAPEQQQQQQAVAAISRQAATRLVQQWLNIKTEAMGPYHSVDRLPEVLAEPMLSAVSKEAAGAAEAGWFWRIRPLRCKVDSIDGGSVAADGSGHITVLATVSESAGLWASNGKQADSYHTTYQVEYAVIWTQHGWRIASATVLGK